MKNDSLFTIRLNTTNFDIVHSTARYIAKYAISCGVNTEKYNYITFTIESVIEKRLQECLKNNSEVIVSTKYNAFNFVINIQDKGTPYFLNNHVTKAFNNGLCDHYSLSQLGKEGVVLSISYIIDTNVEHRSPINNEEPLLDTEFKVRKTKSSNKDINEAIKCLYDAYEYEYVHQGLYNFSSFRRYLKSGNFVSFLCENKHHQVLAHCGLREYSPFYGMPEFGNLVTKKLSRGHGIAQLCLNNVIEYASKHKYQGIYVDCYAAHPFTEKICNKANFTPCCALFQLVNPESAGPYKKGDLRLDCLGAITLFNKNKEHIIYAPNYIKPICDYIFNKENVNYKLITKISNKNKSNSIVKYEIDNTTRTLSVVVDYFGCDYQMIKNEIVSERLKKIVDLTILNINISNETAINAINFAKQNDFVFTGIIPGGINGDYAVMERFFTQPLSYDNAVAIENYDTLIKIIKEINK